MRRRNIEVDFPEVGDKILTSLYNGEISEITATAVVITRRGMVPEEKCLESFLYEYNWLAGGWYRRGE